MSNSFNELKKTGTLKLPNGGKLTKEGKSAIYENNLKVRATLKLDADAVESALADQPIVVLLESLMELNQAEVIAQIALLTARELEVFGEMGLGLKNRLIAEKLGISTKTLDIHRAAIGRKLGIKTMNGFGRVYWFFRIINEFAPELLVEARKARETDGDVD
jgi:DNA-binding CsgD family transcriptional regulator